MKLAKQMRNLGASLNNNKRAQMEARIGEQK